MARNLMSLSRLSLADNRQRTPSLPPTPARAGAGYAHSSVATPSKGVATPSKGVATPSRSAVKLNAHPEHSPGIF